MGKIKTAPTLFSQCLHLLGGGCVATTHGLNIVTIAKYNDLPKRKWAIYESKVYKIDKYFHGLRFIDLNYPVLEDTSSLKQLPPATEAQKLTRELNYACGFTIKDPIFAS